MNKVRLLINVVTVFMILLVVSLMLDIFDTRKYMTCYEQQCVKTTLDQFENCKDLGIEHVGFLSDEHYYLCDGNKITKRCIDWKWVLTNKKYISLGMKCEAKK